MDAKIIIAKRAAQELIDGEIVNLGIGMPTMLTQFLDPSLDITFQSENGILGMGAEAQGDIDPNITNAGGTPVTVKSGACFFDSATSFGIIRGGHVDKTVLGALQVDSEGSLASHIIPGKMVPGMGGAMDLVAGAKQVIVITTHTAKGDAPKILKKCTLPLTAYKKVNRIITELAVIDCTSKGLILRERHVCATVEQIKSLTEAELIIPDNVGVFE